MGSSLVLLHQLLWSHLVVVPIQCMTAFLNFIRKKRAGVFMSYTMSVRLVFDMLKKKRKKKEHAI